MRQETGHRGQGVGKPCKGLLPAVGRATLCPPLRLAHGVPPGTSFHSSAAIRVPLTSPASSQSSSLQGGPGRPQARLPHPPPAPEALCTGSLNPCTGPGSLLGYLSTRTLMCGCPRPLLIWHPSSHRLDELQNHGSWVPQPGPSQHLPRKR